MFDKLFLYDRPGVRTGNIQDDLNPKSIIIFENACIDKNLLL